MSKLCHSRTKSIMKHQKKQKCAGVTYAEHTNFVNTLKNIQFTKISLSTTQIIGQNIRLNTDCGTGAATEAG